MNYFVNNKKINKRQLLRMGSVRNIHFVGIGGIGMSGIAELLMNDGYQISGSDLSPNSITQKFKKLGIQIFYNHNKKNIYESDVLVISSAISADNPELIEAKKYNIPIIQRAEMLAELMRFRQGIAISGTHGKTTTTAMIANIYYEAGLDPSFVNGGIIKSTGVHARLGSGSSIIVEADESDASFLYLQPIISVVTNIEEDHMDTYQGNFNNLKKTFLDFLHKLPFYGSAIICIDDPVIREILPKIERKIVTYGFSNDADLLIDHYSQKGTSSMFTIYRNKKPILKVKLNIPGRHNALNAVAAIATAIEEGINNEIILQAMLKFQGTSRRFDELGIYKLNKINGKKGEIILVDDYGHHPTEINATIESAREAWPDRRLVMVFQPHKFTRTRDLYNYFAKVLSNVDILLMLDVYPSGEAPIPGADSKSLCSTIRKYGKINPILIKNINLLQNVLYFILDSNDLLLMQGAGTISNIAHNLASNKFRQ